MADKVQLIKEKIERLYTEVSQKPYNGEIEGEMCAYDKLISFINSLPEEPVSEDLEEELNKYVLSKFTIDKEQLDRFGIKPEDYTFSLDKRDLMDIAHHFAEWQENKDKQSLIDNGTVLLTEDEFEKLKRSIIQSEKDKQQMKEALQTEYEKGRFDMREGLIKNTVLETKVMMDCDGDGIETPYEEWLTLENTEIPYIPNNLGLKEGDKVKIIIVKEEQ